MTNAEKTDTLSTIIGGAGELVGSPWLTAAGALGRAAGKMLAHMHNNDAEQLILDLRKTTDNVSWNLPMFADQVQNYVADNPAQAAVVMQALARLTKAGTLTKMVDYVKSEVGESSPVYDYIRDLYNHFKPLAEQEQKLIGDGDPDTVWGMKKDEWRKHAELTNEGVAAARYLGRIFGGIKKASKVRDLMFRTPTEFFEEAAHRYPGEM